MLRLTLWQLKIHKPVEKFTNRRDCGDNFSQLELVQDGGFSRSVQSYHEDSHLFLAKEAFEQACEHITHGGGLVEVDELGERIKMVELNWSRDRCSRSARSANYPTFTRTGDCNAARSLLAAAAA